MQFSSAMWLVMSLCVRLCAGHGAMMLPPSWSDPDGSHTNEAGGETIVGCKDRRGSGCAFSWFTNNTMIPGEPTIKSEDQLLTYKDSCGEGVAACCTFKGFPACDWTRKHPWRSPGTAPVHSPCGVDGGNPRGCPEGSDSTGACPGGGFGHGIDGRSMPGNTKPAEWTIGGVADVAWGAKANHGGGYSYRLCKKSSDYAHLTEECFQKNVLQFHGNKQWIQDKTSKTEIQAIRTADSHWTRNPIPACGQYGTGDCSKPQFKPPAAGVVGFNNLRWNVVDKVDVPGDLHEGDYVVSWRWDCEQTTQVWSACGDVKLVKQAGANDTANMGEHMVV
eukprot:TRINITY_DN10776_c0_g1_i1.p1 TRINITY_DN10776_c0_g1~~TRINITY_DN10776_c0_g1_i1.p1  ORF type:complete len:333 (-),score=52.61 TRINITY_DN10776_c0_g1_i1:63-1061(-)